MFEGPVRTKSKLTDPNTMIMKASIYSVSQKNSQNSFWHNFVKFPPTLIIFSVMMGKTILLCKIQSFFILPNLCQRTTLWNTDAPNCYITQRLVVSDGSPLHYQFDSGCKVFNNFEVLNILWWKLQTTKYLTDELKTRLIDEWMHLISRSLIPLSTSGVASKPLRLCMQNTLS